MTLIVLKRCPDKQCAAQSFKQEQANSLHIIEIDESQHSWSEVPAASNSTAFDCIRSLTKPPFFHLNILPFY